MIQDSTFILVICGVYLLGLFLLLGRGLVPGDSVPWLAVLFWIFGMWPIGQNLTVPRNLNYLRLGSAGWHMRYQVPLELEQVGQLSTLVVFICAFIFIFRTSRNGFPSPGRALWITFLLSTTGQLVSTFFGLIPTEFSHNLIKPAVFFTVFYLAFNKWPEKVPLYAKRVCMVFFIASILASMLQPDWAVLFGLKGWIPGFDYRLFGVASNPNSLAPIALLYLFLDFSDAAPSRFRWPGRLFAFVILLWAQSKTIWIAAIVGFTLQVWFNSGAQAQKRTPKQLLVRFAMYSTPVIFLLLLFYLPDESYEMNPGLNAGLVSNFSGRRVLWDITIDAWRRWPVFGYGMTLWSEGFRVGHGLKGSIYATHAHSMYFQTLGTTGIYGLTMYLVFVLTLARTAWQTREISRGWSLSLVSLPLIRALSESSFLCNGIGETVFYEMVVIGMLIKWQCRQDADRRIGVEHE